MFKKVLLSMLMLSLITTCAMAGEWMDLFDGKTLNGWSVHSGSAKYRVEDGATTICLSSSTIFGVTGLYFFSLVTNNSIFYLFG